MRKLFGTDGIRGIANIEPMTVETAVKLGRAAAYMFKHKAGRHRIVIGKDTRLSGYMLECALTSGICSMGVDVLLVGPLPTPGIAFVTRSLRADAGIVISGSHNPFQDNGIKFFSKDGLKLPDELEKRIEELLFTGEIDSIRPTAKEVGKAYRIDDAIGRYIEFAKNSIPKGTSFEGFKIVIDCANGASYRVTPWVLKELGAEVVTLNDEPNGTNINLNCGSLYPEVIQKVVKEHDADIGISHDGDADRVILVDERGQIVDGDHILAACALDMIKEGRLKKNTVVTTVMSNVGLEIAIKKMGGRVARTPVGDRYVLEEMLKGGYNFGGEQSGHIIFLDHNTTGDGLITTLQVLHLMKKTGNDLSKLTSCMTSLPQVLINVPISKRKDPTGIPQVKEKIEGTEKRLDGIGRVLVRLSGTEAMARVMVEGKKKKEIEEMAQEIAEAIKKNMP